MDLGKTIERIKEKGRITLLTSLLLLEGCCSLSFWRPYITPSPITPTDRMVFDRIKKPYILDLHDCDDMTQEFRDYLTNVKKVDTKHLRLVKMRKRTNGAGHLFLQWYRGREWKTFDPANKIFNGAERIHYKRFYMNRILKGTAAYNDNTGYEKHGDVFIKYSDVSGTYINMAGN